MIKQKFISIRDNPQDLLALVRSKMSVAVATTLPIVTFPGAPNMWEEWSDLDFILPANSKTDPKDISYGGFMDIEEITVVVKRPRRIRHTTPTKSPVLKRVRRPVKINTDNVKTLSEYQTEKQKHIDAAVQEQKQEEQKKQEDQKQEEQKKQEEKKKQKEKKQKEKKKNDGWTTVKKDEKPASPIRRPEREVPVKSVQSNGTTLILKNLPKTRNVSAQEIKKFFGKCGTIKFVNILFNEDGTCRGTAFVKFENKTGSDKGLKMNEFWYEDNKVYVEYTRN